MYNDIPVGSTSFKKHDDECTEVKHVFIKQKYRDKGILSKLIIRECCTETGLTLPDFGIW